MPAAMRLTMQILDDGAWIDVMTRARDEKGMKRLYARMCNERPFGPPYGLRLVFLHFEHLGRLKPLRKRKSAA